MHGFKDGGGGSGGGPPSGNLPRLSNQLPFGSLPQDQAGPHLDTQHGTGDTPTEKSTTCWQASEQLLFGQTSFTSQQQHVVKLSQSSPVNQGSLISTGIGQATFTPKQAYPIFTPTNQQQRPFTKSAQASNSSDKVGSTNRCYVGQTESAAVTLGKTEQQQMLNSTGGGSRIDQESAKGKFFTIEV